MAKSEWCVPTRSLGSRVSIEARFGKEQQITDVVRVQFYPVLWQGMGPNRTETILHLKTKLLGMNRSEANQFLLGFAKTPTEDGFLLHDSVPFGLYRVF